jgi:Fe-S cluster assembly iron-binding protein IscA
VIANAAGLVAKGSTRSITLTALVKPDHDIDDVVEATRVRAGIAPGSLFVLDNFSITFGTAGTLQAGCRSVVA